MDIAVLGQQQLRVTDVETGTGLTNDRPVPIVNYVPLRPLSAT